MKPKLIVSGAAGRMGKRITSLAVGAGFFDIIAAIEKKDHTDIGKTIPQTELKLSETPPPGADVVIDFSQPQAAGATVNYCLDNISALVLGTTGLSPHHHENIKAASAKIPVIYGTNMSIGMNVLFSLAGKTAKMLGDDYDIEIIEQHHRFKKDAPSGSALTLAENICKATGGNYPDCLTYGREGGDALRQKGKIGIHAVRAGDITGNHSVIFSSLGETVTLSHSAHSRDGFAAGALKAAEWLIGKKPGLYSMFEVLGIE
ncbi:MAG: 4-hydroxy-tetrahydrodipicolinate reductase [Planctomycetota bacterium]|jgi:4-hydroxy-tetrahydrodipicolinate reductase